MQGKPAGKLLHCTASRSVAPSFSAAHLLTYLRLPPVCSYGRGGERGTARPEVLQELLKTTDRVVQVGLAHACGVRF